MLKGNARNNNILTLVVQLSRSPSVFCWFPALQFFPAVYLLAAWNREALPGVERNFDCLKRKEKLLSILRKIYKATLNIRIYFKDKILGMGCKRNSKTEKDNDKVSKTLPGEVYHNFSVAHYDEKIAIMTQDIARAVVVLHARDKFWTWREK